MKPHLITISTKTILKIVVTVLLLWLLYIIRDIVLLFFVAVILASLIEPWAAWWEHRKVPRSLSILAIYVVLVGIAAAVVVLLLPPIVREGQGLVKNLNTYWEATAGSIGDLQHFSTDFNILERAKGLLLPSSGAVGKTLGGIIATVSGVFGGVFSLLLVLVLAFYLVVEEESAGRWVRALAPDHYQPFLTRLFKKMQRKLGSWLRAQLVLSLIVGVFTYVGLTILGVEYALVLALIAAVLELVPYVGPVLSAVPALFLAFTQTGSWTLPLAVLALFVVIQQLENDLLVPRVMQKAVGLNPVVSIMAILIGARIAGIIGALLAIPVATVIYVFTEQMKSERK